MFELAQEQEAELARLCRRYGVQRLELFGSATGPRFSPPRSDLDFLVEFDKSAAGRPADRYFGLWEALQGLFGRPVDLVMITAIRNPYFLQAIEPSRMVVYAA